MKLPRDECFVKIAAVTPRTTTNKTPCSTKLCEFKAIDNLEYCAYHLREVRHIAANIENNAKRHQSARKPTKKAGKV